MKNDSLEWPKIIQAKRTISGKVITEYRDNIIITEFARTKLNEYISNEFIITTEKCASLDIR